MIAIGGGLNYLKVQAASANRYEEVKDWPKLPAGVALGEVAGVSVDGVIGVRGR